jgi:hypothetical protein
MNDQERRQINDESLREFFSKWDTDWRWLLLLGLRDLRGNTQKLGAAAMAATGSDTWSEESYLFGPVALGITAAAVSEAAQYCEDLFALLKFLREPTHFVQRMMSYSAGQVTNFGHSLETMSDEKIRRLFIVPDPARIRAALDTVEAPNEDARLAEEGVERLLAMTREVVAWYQTYQAFHNQYKHGLKVALRPYGTPIKEAIDERKQHVRAPLFAFSNDSPEQLAKLPPAQQAVSFFVTSDVMRKNLVELSSERSLLSLRLAGPEVDLERVVGLGRVVMQLLRIAKHNRLTLGEGLDPNGQQVVHLPASLEGWGVLELRLEPETPLRLENFI